MTVRDFCRKCGSPVIANTECRDCGEFYYPTRVQCAVALAEYGRPDLCKAFVREPDLEVFEAHGLWCLLVRTVNLHWSGYVGVASDHPGHGSVCGFGAPEPLQEVSVHGGLSFGADDLIERYESLQEAELPPVVREGGLWWLGFDCSHGGDISPRVVLSDLMYGMSPMGGTYRTVDYAHRELERLAFQLAAL